MISNITKLEEKLSLVSLMLEEFQKSFQIRHEETNKLTKQVDQLQEKLSQMKVKYEKIKQSKINLIAELDCLKKEHKEGVSRFLLKPEKKKKQMKINK